MSDQTVQQVGEEQLESEILAGLEQSIQEFKAGKAKVLRSLAELPS